MSGRKRRSNARIAQSLSASAKSTREPLLNVHEIQGNILAGFNKDHQLLIALKIVNVHSAKNWLRRICVEISSTAEVAKFNELFRVQRKRLGRDPKGLISTWANIAFTHQGLAMLSSKADAD